MTRFKRRRLLEEEQARAEEERAQRERAAQELAAAVARAIAEQQHQEAAAAPEEESEPQPSSNPALRRHISDEMKEREIGREWRNPYEALTPEDNAEELAELEARAIATRKPIKHILVLRDGENTQTLLGDHFNNISLRGVRFLLKVTFANQSFINSELDCRYLDQVKFNNCDLRGTQLNWPQIRGLSLRNCDLRGITFWYPYDYTGIKKHYFENCDLSGVKLDARDLEPSFHNHDGVRFKNCKTAGIQIENAHLLTPEQRRDFRLEPPVRRNRRRRRSTEEAADAPQTQRVRRQQDGNAARRKRRARGKLPGQKTLSKYGFFRIRPEEERADQAVALVI